MDWALRLRATTGEEPQRLIRFLSGAILGCGGWILSRDLSAEGSVAIAFEFERRVCIDIYTVMISAGLVLSQNSHLRFTELCQCTRNLCFAGGGTTAASKALGSEIASVELEILPDPETRHREEPRRESPMV